MARDRDGEPVAPEDVLDPAELADYYNRHGWPTTTQMMSWAAPETDDEQQETAS